MTTITAKLVGPISGHESYYHESMAFLERTNRHAAASTKFGGWFDVTVHKKPLSMTLREEKEGFDGHSLKKIWYVVRFSEEGMLVSLDDSHSLGNCVLVPASEIISYDPDYDLR